MRIWTLAISILVHSLALVVIVAVPLFATGVLPVPHHVTEAISLVTDLPPLPPLKPVQRRPVRPPSHTTTTPIEVPDNMPERIAEPLENNPIDAGPGDLLTITPPTDIVAAEPALPSIAPPPQRVRVGGLIRAPRKIHDVVPTYPALARASRTEGIVILQVLLGEDGLVQDVSVLRSVQLLDAAAVDAVRQWGFTPTLLNGQPVPLVMTVTVTFSLH